jgi:hypothetical protein
MADSVPGSWISDYLIHLGERYGGDVGRIPLFSKKKKVRLSEVNVPITFLCFSLIGAMVDFADPICL